MGTQRTYIRIPYLNTFIQTHTLLDTNRVWEPNPFFRLIKRQQSTLYANNNKQNIILDRGQIIIIMRHKEHC